MGPGQVTLAHAISMGISTTSLFLGPFGPIIAFVTGAAILVYLPDIMVGIDTKNSDDLKGTAYHELGHASHFTNLNNQYWNTIVWAEIIAFGHGNANSLNAPMIALVESWAEFIGATYASRTYAGFTQHPPLFTNWLTYLERTRNESLNHVPIGFFMIFLIIHRMVQLHVMLIILCPVDQLMIR